MTELCLRRYATSLQNEANAIYQWTLANNFQLNSLKCKEFIITFKKSPIPYESIVISNLPLERVTNANLLGLNISNDLKWKNHVDQITKKAAKKLYLLKQLKRANANAKDLVRFYCSCIRSIWEYSCQVFHCNLPKYLSHDIERIQKRAMRMVFPDLSYNEACLKANLPKLSERRDTLSQSLFANIVRNNDHKLAHLLPKRAVLTKDLRTVRTFQNQICRTDRFKKSFVVYHADKYHYY